MLLRSAILFSISFSFKYSRLLAIKSNYLDFISLKPKIRIKLFVLTARILSLFNVIFNRLSLAIFFGSNYTSLSEFESTEKQEAELVDWESEGLALSCLDFDSLIVFNVELCLATCIMNFLLTVGANENTLSFFRGVEGDSSPLFTILEPSTLSTVWND